MNQSVVIDYVDRRDESKSALVEPLSIVWKALEASAGPHWYLMAWVYPAGELLAFPMESIRIWTPVVDDNEGEEQVDEPINVSDYGC